MDTFEPGWVAQILDGGQSATFTAAGQLKYGDPDVVENEFVYVMETEKGKFDLLRHAEFLQRVGAVKRVEPADSDAEEDTATSRGTGSRDSASDAADLSQLPPILVEPGEPLCGMALVAEPQEIPGVRAWTFETQRHRGGITSVVHSPDGTKLATGGYDGTVRIWDAANGESLQILHGHDDPVMAVAWSPDVRYLVSAGRGGKICLWE